MTDEIRRCYQALELETDASWEQVKQAYRDLVRVWHPDRFPNDDRMQRKAQEKLKEVNLAYENLEEFLTSDSTAPRGRPSASQSSDAARGQNRQRQGPESTRTKSPPPPPPPPNPNERTADEPRKSWAGVVARAATITIGIGIVLGLAIIGFLIYAFVSK
jgi:hypothetical protein